MRDKYGDLYIGNFLLHLWCFVNGITLNQFEDWFYENKKYNYSFKSLAGICKREMHLKTNPHSQERKG